MRSILFVMGSYMNTQLYAKVRIDLVISHDGIFTFLNALLTGLKWAGLKMYSVNQ